jgi:DNA-3-methyladenine glycosylase
MAFQLGREFYARPVLVVARDCIGKVLVHRTEQGEAAGRIVEAEAYRGPLDLAAHSARGLTKRTAAMFGPPGHAYVYLVWNQLGDKPGHHRGRRTARGADPRVERCADLS